MNRKIIALGVSAVSAATFAFGAIGPATAAEAPPGSITTAVCNGLPAQVLGLVNQLTSLTGTFGTAMTDYTTKNTALNTAVTDLVVATVAHITTINGGGNVVASGQVLAAKSSVFSDKVVAANNALTAVFEAQRAAWSATQTQAYVTGIQSGLCI